jgi:EAL domain-containing protein (putative c-di-GMP-specific phosphodiesterase class I)
MPAIIVISAVDDLLLATIKLAAKERGYNMLGAFSKPVSVADLMAALTTFSKQRSDALNTTGFVFEEQLPESEVKEALHNGELRAFFQPIVSTLGGQEVVAVEALARWRHPVRGEVFPAGFIPMLEHSGLMAEFSQLIIRQSVEQLRLFRDNGLDISISINITTLELERFEWVEELFDLVDEYRVPPAKITLEVTEAMTLSGRVHVTETLARLRLKGFGLSIDDFGIGYLSLSNFQRVAFTEIKIDRCLTENLLEDVSLQKIVSSIIRLGHDLGLKVVAEAVEDEEILRQLKLLGCDMIQGLAYSGAMNSTDIVAWCLERNENIN